jgi:hypothetical protein
MNKTEFCKKHGISTDQFCGKQKITVDLDLRSLTSIPAGFNPVELLPMLKKSNAYGLEKFKQLITF